MRSVNRTALLVRPRDPYLRWAASLDPAAAKAAEGLRSHLSVYLVPEDPSGAEETPPLEDYFIEIFEAELQAWSTDEHDWPARRDFETFAKWFDVTGESIVMDLGDGTIEAEDV